MKPWQYALIGVTALLVFVLLLIFIIRDRAAPGVAEGPDGGRGDGAPGREDNYFAEPFFSGGDMDPEFILTQYKRYAIYPPTSRPLTRKMIDLIQPNQRYESFLPTGGPPPGFDAANPPKTPPRADSYYLLTGDRYYVIGESPIVFTLQAAKLPTPDAEPLPVKILTASVNKGRSHLNYTKVMDVRFSDDGDGADRRAGDNIHTLSFVPGRTTLANYHGRLQLYVKFEVGGTTTEALVPFEFFPTGTIPARFNGRFADAIKDGSLAIRAGLDVEQAGYYVIDANLFDREDNPIAYTRFKGDLERGAQEVELVFFGKVLVDQDGAGPYRLKNLRGYRLLEGKFPDRQLIPPYSERSLDNNAAGAIAYQTSGDYSDVSVFSEKEWESPRKKAKLEFLQKEIESGVTMPEPPQP